MKFKTSFCFVMLSIFFVIGCNHTPNQQENILVESNLIYQNKTLWNNGQVIDVLFMDRAEHQHIALIKRVAVEWEKYANIKFNFLKNKPSVFSRNKIEIRISFTNNGNNSHIGRNSLSVSQKKASMNLTPFVLQSAYSEARGVILHEFGHALGLVHEHLHINRSFEFNMHEVNKRCKNYGWSVDKCELNFHRTLDDKLHSFGEYDPTSVMHYSFHHSEITGENIYGSRNYLSLNDRLEIASIYPGKISKEDILLEYAKEIEIHEKIKLQLEQGIKPQHGHCELIQDKDIFAYRYKIHAINEQRSTFHFYDLEDAYISMINDPNCNISQNQLDIKIKKFNTKSKRGKCIVNSPGDFTGYDYLARCSKIQPFSVSYYEDDTLIPTSFCFSNFETAKNFLYTGPISNKCEF